MIPNPTNTNAIGDPEMTFARNIVFHPLYADVVVPERATSGAAGYDVKAHLKGRRVQAMVGAQEVSLYASDSHLVLEPGMRAAIPLGFRAALPTGLEAQLRLRSSVAFRKGIVMPNAPATVDPDYPGEWLVLVANSLQEAIRIHHLERIAQIIFSRFETVDWVPGEVTISSDRTGGLGSTG